MDSLFVLSFSTGVLSLWAKISWVSSKSYFGTQLLRLSFEHYPSLYKEEYSLYGCVLASLTASMSFVVDGIHPKNSPKNDANLLQVFLSFFFFLILQKTFGLAQTWGCHKHCKGNVWIGMNQIWCIIWVRTLQTLWCRSGDSSSSPPHLCTGAGEGK